jgi:predicted RND superfamily exporter protein
VVLLATGWVGLIATLTTGSLNPLTVAIGSLVTATGCEFAVMLSARSDGRPVTRVLTAALAGTAGYLVLGASKLAVLRDFGLLLAAGVVCSLLAALLVHAVLGQPRRAPTEGQSAVDADAQLSVDDENVTARLEEVSA